MNNKRILWTMLSVLSMIGFMTAYYLFPKAMPIFNIDIKMDRDLALSESMKLAEQYNIGPADFSQVASFGVEQDVQNYIELEAGNVDTFIYIIKNDIYQPYAWSVRHYEPENVNEAWFYFTPEGKAYGFSETISDDLEGAALTSSVALNIANSKSAQNWGVDFSQYTLIEESEELKSSGRVDHKFVYHRPNMKLGDEGEYRLQLMVSGDKLTEVKRFIKIPETFSRKYAEMRSFNNTIAQVALYGMILFYFIGGIVIGLFLLNKARWVVWKPAIYWGALVAFVMMIVQINFWPLFWLGYDTAVSPQNFMLQNVIGFVGGFLVSTLYLSLSFLAAEGLTRKAFPEHVQLWKAWDHKGAASYQILSRTVGGYLLVGFNLSFVVIFYYLTTKYFGWWVPSGPLLNPNVIATPLPWIMSIGISLQAGFWEECLFRAIPIAGAAIIGKKYGQKRLFIGLALILQAVIFAAAHANYPSMPAYSRLVELFIPSIVWGLIYIRFGLLPCIISHFTYDVILISIPIFISSSSGILFDQLVVIILALVPLWIVLQRRFSVGRWIDLSNSYYNKAFKPQRQEAPKTDSKQVDIKSISSNYPKYLMGFGAAGILLLFLSKAPDYNNLNLEISRNQAISLADSYLKQNNIVLDDSWTQLTSIVGSVSADDRFIWQTKGRELYDALIGIYLPNSQWRVRYAKFEGSLDEKTEEYFVFLNYDGSLNRINHKIPENKSGENLDEPTAKKLVLDYLSNTYKLDISDLKEIQSQPTKQNNRTDWSFVFQDIKTQVLDSGELRVNVVLSGNEVTSSNQFIHIPEEWERQDKDSQTSNQVFSAIAGMVLIVIFIYGIINSTMQWSSGVFNINIFKTIASILLGIGFVNLINTLPQEISSFATDQPYLSQMFSTFGGGVIFLAINAFSLAVIFGFVKGGLKKEKHQFSIFDGILISLGFIGFMSYVNNYDSVLSPVWIKDINHINSMIPILSHISSAVSSYLYGLAMVLIIVNIISRLTNKWTEKVILSAILVILLSLAIEGVDTVESLSHWLISGITGGVLFILIYSKYIRYDITILPLVLAILSASGLIVESLSMAFPGIFIAYTASSLIILALGWYLRQLFLN